MVDALDDGQLDTRWLEVACGEAPFITNRYDAETGEDIPPERRAGILDRKPVCLSRANVLLSAVEAVKNFSPSDLAELAEIVAWNFFPFDGTRHVGRKFVFGSSAMGKKFFITPARFLFNAGKTPKDFNRRMLDDPHFKVLDYAPDARKYFPGVEIKGGVAVTMRDDTKNFGAIKIFARSMKFFSRSVNGTWKNFMPTIPNTNRKSAAAATNAD